MGFVGSLKFAFKCFDLLAWPLFSLGCPLYASVQAIETNSNSDMRNLVAYWIIFSVISLLELVFVKLLDWLPFWPHMKLLAIYWLVVPHFNGACYVYERLLRPCLTVNPQVVINYFIKPKEDPSLNAEIFLAAAEKYVKENGSEALEKLIDGKFKHTKPYPDVEEIKAVTNTDQKETAAPFQSKHTKPYPDVEEIKAVTNTDQKEAAAPFLPKFKEPTVAKDSIEAVELKEKNPTPVENLFKPKGPNFAKENTKSWKIKEKNPAATPERPKFKEPIVAKDSVEAVELREKNPTVAENSFKTKVPNFAKENTQSWEIKEKNPAATPELVKSVDSNRSATKKKTVGAEEIKEKTVAEAGGENKVPKIPASEKVQREWTCALCQVTTTSENDLNGHLHGKKHKSMWEELIASKQGNKNKGCSAAPKANDHEAKKSHSSDLPKQNNHEKQDCHEAKKSNSGDRLNQNNSKKLEGKVQPNQARAKFWCSICDVNLLSEIDLASHFRGKKHLSNLQTAIDSLGAGH